jgi:hypothetical protein
MADSKMTKEQTSSRVCSFCKKPCGNYNTTTHEWTNISIVSMTWDDGFTISDVEPFCKLCSSNPINSVVVIKRDDLLKFVKKCTSNTMIYKNINQCEMYPLRSILKNNDGTMYIVQCDTCGLWHSVLRHTTQSGGGEGRTFTQFKDGKTKCSTCKRGVDRRSNEYGKRLSNARKLIHFFTLLPRKYRNELMSTIKFSLDNDDIPTSMWIIKELTKIWSKHGMMSTFSEFVDIQLSVHKNSDQTTYRYIQDLLIIRDIAMIR